MPNEVPAPIANGSANVDGSSNSNQSSDQQQQLKSTQTQQTQSTQPKAWKSKVDGKDVTWSSEEELVKDAGLGKAAFHRMREASEAKKATEDFWENFSKDPMRALEDPRLKLTPEKRRELIEKYYQKAYLETDELSPDQKRIRELEEDKRKRDEKDQKDADAKKADQQKQLSDKWRGTYQQQIIEAIEKGGFPKTPRTAARVAFYMAQAAESGFDAPLEMIVQQVGKDYESELQVILADGVPLDVIMKILPPNFVKRLRKWDLDQYKAKQNKLSHAPQQEDPSASRAPRAKKEERPSYADVLRKFGS